jgi:hypothetical protein
VLARLAGGQFLAAPAGYQEELFAALRTIARERFGEITVEGLGAIAGIRSRLLLEGDLTGLIALGRRTEAFVVDARVTRSAWTNGRLGIEFRAILSRGADAHPLTLVERDGAVLLDPAVADDLVGPVDVTDELGAIRLQVSLVERETALEWIVPGGAGLSVRSVGDAEDEGRLPALVGLVELDPQRVGPGEQRLDDGGWEVLIRWSGLGLQATGLLRFSRRARRAEAPPMTPALLGRPLRWIVPRADADGALRISIGGQDRLPARIDDAARRVLRDGDAVAIALPIAADRSGRIAAGTLRLTGEAGSFDLPATFEGSLGTLVVSVGRVRAQGKLPRGRFLLTAHLGGGDAPGLPLGAVVVRDDGRFVVVGIRRVSGFARIRSWASWAGRSMTHGARTRALIVFRRLPPSAKDTIRARYGRFRA